MNRKQKYIQYLISPIIPLVFTILWLVYAGYETNISVLLSKSKIRIFPQVLCGISLIYLFWKLKDTPQKYIRVLFFLCAILTLIFPYIELALIKNMHLIFAYSTLVLYIILIKDLPAFFQYRTMFFMACIFCFFDCILQMKITGLSEVIFLWVNAYILVK